MSSNCPQTASSCAQPPYQTKLDGQEARPSQGMKMAVRRAVPQDVSCRHWERLIRHHTRRLGKLGVRVDSLRPEPEAARRRTRAGAKRTQEVVENT